MKTSTINTILRRFVRGYVDLADIKTSQNFDYLIDAYYVYINRVGKQAEKLVIKTIKSQLSKLIKAKFTTLEQASNYFFFISPRFRGIEVKNCGEKQYGALCKLISKPLFTKILKADTGDIEMLEKSAQRIFECNEDNDLIELSVYYDLVVQKIVKQIQKFSSTQELRKYEKSRQERGRQAREHIFAEEKITIACKKQMEALAALVLPEVKDIDYLTNEFLLETVGYYVYAEGKKFIMPRFVELLEQLLSEPVPKEDQQKIKRLGKLFYYQGFLEKDKTDLKKKFSAKIRALAEAVNDLDGLMDLIISHTQEKYTSARAIKLLQTRPERDLLKLARWNNFLILCSGSDGLEKITSEYLLREIKRCQYLEALETVFKVNSQEKTRRAIINQVRRLLKPIVSKRKIPEWFLWYLSEKYQRAQPTPAPLKALLLKKAKELIAA